jgi:phospholipid-translocating ATPase
MFDGLYQSAVCFFLPYFLYWKGGFVTNSGLDLNSTSEIGVFVACGTITVVNVYILMNQQHWDWLFLLIVALSVLSVWFWTGIYSQFQATPTFYKIAAHVFGTLPFWAVTFLMIAICLLPRFTVKVIQKFYYPHDSDIIREQVRLHMFDDPPVAGEQSHADSSVLSPRRLKGFLSSISSGSGKSGKSGKLGKSRSPSPAKFMQQYVNDDERPIYPPSVTLSQTGRRRSQSDADDSSETATQSPIQSRGHNRRSTDHTERWLSHASPIIPEIVEVQ